MITIVTQHAMACGDGGSSIDDIMPAQDQASKSESLYVKKKTAAKVTRPQRVPLGPICSNLLPKRDASWEYGRMDGAAANICIVTVVGCA